MKILYLAHRIPYPPNKGDKIRSYNELKYLSQGHEVDLLSLVDEPDDLQYKEELEQLCNRVGLFPLNKLVSKVKGIASLATGGTISVGYFYQKKMQQEVDLWLQEETYDAIICFSSTMAEYVFRSKVFSSLSHSHRPKLVMDFCDVDSDKWIQYAAEAKFPMNSVYRLENRQLADYERRVYEAFDHTLLISAVEANLFREICPEHGKVTVIPNGVDYEYFDSRKCAPNSRDESLSLVFTGAMDYHANVDGVVWFCKDIWPQLKQEFPALTFYIVGSNPTVEVRELAKIDGITVTGFVDDIRDYYNLADICAVPLRLARGVQNKVLEAMAMGKAVVTTSKANDGIQATDGEQLRVATTADEFIQAVRVLLKDSEGRTALGNNAREFVVARYDWKTNLEKLEKLLF
ncbi:MAG: TIGR03087 family PEP-CTERM/XrtA system glycosyltransferase [Desulfuromonadales bacterium]|nr:TIGR03087 family PEP-CTERM/XrtA system glycosyltransferase [Desulfuromonadales bacterium]